MALPRDLDPTLAWLTGKAESLAAIERPPPSTCALRAGIETRWAPASMPMRGRYQCPTTSQITACDPALQGRCINDVAGPPPRVRCCSPAGSATRGPMPCPVGPRTNVILGTVVPAPPHARAIADQSLMAGRRDAVRTQLCGRVGPWAGIGAGLFGWVSRGIGQIRALAWRHQECAQERTGAVIAPVRVSRDGRFASPLSPASRAGTTRPFRPKIEGAGRRRRFHLPGDPAVCAFHGPFGPARRCGGTIARRMPEI